MRLTGVVAASLLGLSLCAANGQSHKPVRVVEDGVPIVFEPAGPITMTGRLPGVTVAWEPRKVTMQLQASRAAQLEIGFVGASAAVPHGSSLATSQSNYLLGNDPTRWRTHVPNYRRVVYSQLYPGIDGVFYGSGQLLEHDFVVSPRADYRQIRLHLSPNAHARLESTGELTIALSGGELRMHKPVIYQDLPGGRQLRKGGFHLLADGDIAFTVASYDPRRALIIDPVLSFSTFLTSQTNDGGYVAADSSGNTYLAGTASLGFPQTPGAFTGCGTCMTYEVAGYVSKLSADGKTLIYSTLIGGNAYTQPYAIAVDGNGHALIAGRTQATDFPTKNGQVAGAANNAASFGFLVSLSADGSSLNYGTLLGGTSAAAENANTTVTALAVDATGNAYVGGDTNSTLYPYTAGALNNGPPSGQASQVFLSKFDDAGNLTYSAFLGDPDGQPGDTGAGGTSAAALALDASGNVYVAGAAGSLWPTTAGVYLRQAAGSAFVAKVAAGGRSFVYSTFLPVSYINGIAALPDGSVFVAGSGALATYPTTANAYQATSTAASNSFLTQVNASGSALVYSTFFGDSTYRLNALAPDPNGDLWVAGQTQGFQFPLVTPLQSVLPLDNFSQTTASTLSEFDPTGTTLKFSTFFGGATQSYATGLAIDANHRAHLAGGAGAGLYTTSGVYLESIGTPGQGYQGADFPYVALVDPNVAAPAVCVDAVTGMYWYFVTGGTFADMPLTITNCGTLPLTISGVTPGAAVFTVPAAKNGCTQSIPVGQSCTLSVRYSPTTAENDAATLTIQSNASIPETLLPLFGMGVVPALHVYSGPAFNFALVGQTSPSQVLIQNAGGAPLILNAANTRISGDFSLQGLAGCSTPMAAGSGCALPIYFTPTAPGSRTGTLQIASNDPANPTVSVALQGTGYSTAPVPQITSVGSQLLPAGVGQTGFPLQGFGFSPSSMVELNGVPQTTTYVSDTALNATLAASSIPANSYGELTLTVVTPGPGGGQSAPVTLTEYQSLQTTNSFLLYEPVGKTLYASIPAASTTNPNTVLPINPVTATPGTPIAVGNDPGVLAASSDGAYLYVALNGDHSIQRINLSTRAIERTFALPLDPEYGSLQVFDMHVVPGHSTELAVSLDQPEVSPAANGVAFFNDAGLVNWIGRGGSIPDYDSVAADIYNFAFTDAGTVWGISAYYGILNELTVSPSGIATTTTTCCSLYNNLASDGTLIYTDSGLVWNPATGQQVAAYPLGTDYLFDSVIADAGTGKTYFLNDFSPIQVLAFDQASLAQTASLTLNSFAQVTAPWGTQMVRWGSNGFALRTSLPAATTTSGIVLFTSSITSASNLNGTLVATTLAPTFTPPGGADFTLTVTGSGFVAGSTVEWNNSPRPTTLISSTQLKATIYASDIATMGTALVVVQNPGQGGTSAALPFTITAQGSAALPAATITPAALTFSSQAVGTTSAGQGVSFANTGNGDVSDIALTLDGPDAADFAQTSNCGTTMSAAASCTITITFAPESAGPKSATLTVTDDAASSPQSVTLSGTAPGETLGAQGLQFIPIAPCRIADTRNAAGSFGGPAIGAMQTRDFPILQSACGLPATAAAYAINVTAVPGGPLNYLTVWPAGGAQPQVSLLNSLDGRVKANSAIVPAGAAGAISVYASSQASTHVVIDISGYFAPPTGSSLEFFPLAPCRIADTRNASGPLGGPSLHAGQVRAFPVGSSPCQVPSGAQAYSLNITAVPSGTLSYLTIWPTGQAQPPVSTLNAVTGAVTANAAIVPAGSGGQVSVFVTNNSDLVMDVNGYFAPSATGGTFLYTTVPCRMIDTRDLAKTPFPGTYTLSLPSSPCTLPSSASALVLNATVIPKVGLGYLTLWAAGEPQPMVSTLNAADGSITSNMAIVPVNQSAVEAFATDSSQLILDVSSYFAP